MEENKTMKEFNINEDNVDMLNEMEFQLGCTRDEAKKVLAFMRWQKLEFDDIENITINDCDLTHDFVDYYVGTDSELTCIARESLDEDLWKSCVAGGSTLLGYYDWVEEVLNMDGIGSVLNGWDGTEYEEKAFDTWYTICRR